MTKFKEFSKKPLVIKIAARLIWLAQWALFLSCRKIYEGHPLEKHPRKWALQVDCTQKVIENLVKRKLIDKDSALFDKFELF